MSFSNPMHHGDPTEDGPSLPDFNELIPILSECYRRAQNARTHEHMRDLMAIARLLSKGLTEAEVMQAKLKAED